MPEIDLGEDLLSQKKLTSEDSDALSKEDLISRARILKDENFLEDAKKLYRKILFEDPQNPVAKAGLDDIQKIEVEKLLLQQDDKKQKEGTKEEKDENEKTLLVALERELGSITEGLNKAVPTLFKTEEEYRIYQDSVLERVLKFTPKERIDIGVAFLEMELFELARQIFESIVRYENYKITGNYLLALALIRSGRAIDATLRLEPLVRDLTIDEKSKTDLLYLMGSAFEAMNDTKRAREFYRRVHQLDPKCRDVLEKIR